MTERIIVERGFRNRGIGRPFTSPHISLCARCRVCTCAWAYGRPVEGWTALPSELYEDGWKVLACPEYEPMRRRKRRRR